jgi:hypothetical protein
MEYIRMTYGVPAMRGGRVRYTGGKSPMDGIITGSDGSRLKIRIPELSETPLTFHPTWELEYLEATK